MANPKIELYYWKNQRHKEVDFVTVEGTGIKKLIQVCWDINKLGACPRTTNN